MSELWARTALQTYRWLGAAIYPFMGTYVAVRLSRGKEERGRRRERYGRSTLSRPDGPMIWIHAASVGETGAVAALIERIRALGINVILTTGTVTSANFARDRLGPDMLHQYVPLDLKPAVSRFLDHWRPDLAIFAESELWPMTILELGARRIPQVLINGRMSDRSYKRWAKRMAVAESLFEHLSHVAVQTEMDGERFSALGARPVTVTGNLKADVDMPPVDERELRRLAIAIGNRPRWAAISTHEGEEVVAARVHKALQKFRPDLITIVVPRHPSRATALRRTLEERGLTVTCRSLREPVTPKTDIYLGDTIGEMGLYLRLTDIAFVGKSLLGEGGQNPLEPAMLGTAVLSGPHVSAFTEAYQRLVDARAARLVDDETALAKMVHHLLSQPKACEAMGRAGARVVAEMGGALDRTWQALDPYIHPLRVQAALRGEGSKSHHALGAAGPGHPGRSALGWK
ncbi:lipid IV(A) 3-deoxy-D-manno-octulosonic acid transferase [Oricola sp.]|uniref:lipid IV(A) 3-deoxy-D-manno-octulosonic acid transferase n=1 Tax=Oricola sp. TaxID=1979950 RepID=UPI0025D1D21A|nr:lipid IV(A) 3-deoxy-D-manno-octulosonic acid transferase [Oricola sp.]MCI5078539.1 lipid IV(A) 3-deoxy-D-manno-octulosonic acid transferase [Oricola sp.]